MKILIAYFLDIIIADLSIIPHPVVLIGKLISSGEIFLRKHLPKCEFIAGMILTLFVVFISFLLPFLILNILYRISYPLGFILEVIFCVQILATKSLHDASIAVYYELKFGTIESARRYLSNIVGRDTEHLDKQAIIRAAVETVSENTSDAIIAPLFFMAIGGAPLAFLYKAVNTLDSMIGYKNDKYIRFGKFAAKLDDVLNFIPARLTGLLFIAASFILRYDYVKAFRIFLRDRYKHESPNSAQIESACAGALNVELGGDSYYEGVLVKKATIGDNIRPLQIEDIRASIKLMYLSSLIAMFILTAARLILL